MSPEAASRLAKDLARAQGFDHCGIARAEPIGRAEYLRAWLAAGRAGTMHYLHRYLEQRLDPRVLLPGARSIVVAALQYAQPEPEVEGDGRLRGRVARYAWGDDYHKVLKRKLFAVADNLREAIGQSFEAKACVDTAPIVEREFAAAAGVGWIGKNTMVIDRTRGSYFVLGLLVTTLDMEPDEPAIDHCGTCSRCLDACPTQAFPAPYEMDASRCISYLTIERREGIPQDLEPLIGDWVFGCDICQEVCPYNRKAPSTSEPRFAVRPPAPRPVLEEILTWSEDEWRARAAGTAMTRATPAMIQRNAGIARRNLLPAAGTGREADGDESAPAS